MSEYEIASLFYQIVATARAAVANYLTVVFAVLVSTQAFLGSVFFFYQARKKGRQSG